MLNTFMANQRDPGKAFIGLWVQRELKLALQSLAEEKEIPLSELAEAFLESELERELSKIDPQNHPKG